MTDVSGFAVDLLLDGVCYAYGFTVDDERVHEEWLSLVQGVTAAP